MSASRTGTAAASRTFPLWAINNARVFAIRCGSGSSQASATAASNFAWSTPAIASSRALSDSGAFPSGHGREATLSPAAASIKGERGSVPARTLARPCRRVAAVACGVASSVHPNPSSYTEVRDTGRPHGNELRTTPSSASTSMVARAQGKPASSWLVTDDSGRCCTNTAEQAILLEYPHNTTTRGYTNSATKLASSTATIARHVVPERMLPGEWIAAWLATCGCGEPSQNKKVPTVGIEPTTTRLRVSRSTELS